MRTLRRFIQFAPSDRQLLVRAGLHLGLVRFALWCLPFRVVLRLVASARRQQPGQAPSRDHAAAQRIAWAVVKTARYVPAATCLTQALATQILLSQYGLDSTLRIGVAKGPADTLAAHAWVERQGMILVGDLPGLTRFVELPVLNSAS